MKPQSTKPKLKTKPKLNTKPISKPDRNYFYEVFSKFWKIVVAIGVICAILASIPTIRSLFLSKHEKVNADRFVEGDIKAPLFKPTTTPSKYSISEFAPNYIIPSYPVNAPRIKGIPIKDMQKQPVIFVSISGFIFPCFANDLYRGIDLFNPVFNDCNSSHLILGVKDNRLYVSVEFKDLKKEETIGIIEFNHWKIFKENYLEYKDDDPEKFEVTDHQNNIVFSISYVQAVNGVLIAGYFIGAQSIIVMPNDASKSKSINPLCVLKTDSNWKQKALEEINLIKSVYK